MIKPIKSIHQAILTALNNRGEQTVDDLADQVTEFARDKIASNISQLAVEGLASRRKDGLTGMPAYKITDLGMSRIKSDAEPVKDSLTTQPAKPVVKQNLTTQISSAPVTVSAAKISEIEAAIDAGQAENGRLHAALKESEQVRDLHAKSLLDLECEKIELLRENSVLRESQSKGVTRIDELSAELDALRTTPEADQQVTVEQFLIRVPKRKPLVVKSFEKARQHAMSAAKAVGKVEVFAMVQVGHAVRGSEWRQA